jgi:hypothetical protein
VPALVGSGYQQTPKPVFAVLVGERHKSDELVVRVDRLDGRAFLELGFRQRDGGRCYEALLALRELELTDRPDVLLGDLTETDGGDGASLMRAQACTSQRR